LLSCGLDEVSQRSEGGCKVTKFILDCVQAQHEAFKCLLRFIRVWAAKRKIYGRCFGYFNGIGLTVLCAYISVQNLDVGDYRILVFKFFQMFSVWNWEDDAIKLGVPENDAGEEKSARMRVFLLSKSCNVVEHIMQKGLARIRSEFLRGKMFSESLSMDFWSLCELETISNNLHRRTYAAIEFYDTDSTASGGGGGSWVGFVESQLFKLSNKFVLYPEKFKIGKKLVVYAVVEENVPSPDQVFSYWIGELKGHWNCSTFVRVTQTYQGFEESITTIQAFCKSFLSRGIVSLPRKRLRDTLVESSEDEPSLRKQKRQDDERV
jgi:poly(A) polymerase Pap1